MKRMGLLFLAAAFGAGLLGPASASHAASFEQMKGLKINKPFTMICKGGKDGGNLMQAIYPGSWVPSKDIQTLRIEFTKAAEPAKTKLPAPGQCAKVDRPFSPNEPHMMYWAAKAGAIIFMIQRFANYDTNIEMFPPTDPALKFLVDAIQRGRMFSVTVVWEAEGAWKNGIFRVIKVGPK